MTMDYLVYEGGLLVGVFLSQGIAKFFIEEWGKYTPRHMDLIDGNTGEVLNTWVNGSWEIED